MEACREGHTACAALLLAAGASPTVTHDSDGFRDETAMHLACVGGHDGCVKLLIEGNRDVILQEANYDATIGRRWRPTPLALV